MDIDSSALYDLSNTDDSIGQFLRSALNVNIDDISDLNDFDQGINKIIKSKVLDHDSVYSYVPDDLSLSSLGFEFTIVRCNILGLDSFQLAEFYNVISSHTIQNSFELKSLSIELVVDVLSQNAEDEMRGQAISERLSVVLSLMDINLSVAFLIALEQKDLESLKLSSLLHTDTILPCIVSIMNTMNLTQFDLEIGAMDGINIQSSSKDRSYDSINKFWKRMIELHKSDLVSSLSEVLKIEIKAIINKYITSNECKALEVETKLDHIDFRDMFMNATEATAAGASGSMPYGNVLPWAMVMLESALLSPDSNGIPKLNNVLIKPFTVSQSKTVGEVYIPSDVFSAGKEGKTEIKISDFRVENLDSIGYPLQFFSPREDQSYVLNNYLTIGSHGKPLIISSTIFIGVKESFMETVNELVVRIEMNDISMLIALKAMIDKNMLMEFPLKYAKNPYCWISTIPAPSLNEFGVRPENSLEEVSLAVDAVDILYGNLNISMDCISCNSPDIESLSNSLNDIFNNSTKISEIFEEFFQGKFFQDQIERFQNTAARNCPFTEFYVDPALELDEDEDLYTPIPSVKFTDESYKAMISFSSLVGIFILFMATTFYFTRRKVMKNHKEWGRALKEDEKRLLYEKQCLKMKNEIDLCRLTQSMAFSASIPLFVRISIPLVILGNIGLFLSGHLSLGASIDIFGEALGEEIMLPQFFEFSMAKSTIDSFKAGAISLAIIITIFSGLWPYTKQLITLYLWFAPPSRVLVSKRGSIFVWLDSFAKWSMIDVYILIITIVAFRISIKSPANLPENFYVFDILVVPLWGLYANMLAQVVSQISSHVIIHYHNKIIKHGIRTVECESYVRRSSMEERIKNEKITQNVRSHVYSKSPNLMGEKLKIRKGVNIMIAILGFLSVVFLLLGCFLPSLRLEVFGLVGLILESGDQSEEAITFHSIYSMVQLIMNEAKFIDTAPQYFGLWTLICILVMTSMIVPALLMFVVLLVWFVSMTRQARDRYLLVIDMLKAWQYVEVYIISMFLAAWQLGGISEFMLNDAYCEELRTQFSVMAHYGFLGEDNAQCFYNQASVSIGTIFLVLSSLISFCLTNFVLKATKQKHEEDDADVQKMDLYLEDMDDDVINVSDIDPPAVQFTDIFQLFLRYEYKNPYYNSSEFDNTQVSTES